MSSKTLDLGVLSRAPLPDRTGPAADPRVPRPRRNWKTRIALPAALLTATAALLAYAARDVIRPATPVRVVPVVVRPVQAGAGETVPEGSTATVQAPGWVEPDPFPVSVTALTDGVVADVLVLEGQTVKAGDVVARLVDADAKLALARAEAELAARQGELASAQAALEAAQAEWDTLVERKRAVASAEALVAEATAELDRLPVEVAAERARADELADALRRTEANVARNAVGEGELVQLRLRYKAQEAMVASTEAKRPVLAAKVQQHAADLVAARDALRLRIVERKALDEAKASLRQIEAAVRQASAARDEAKLRLERTEVRSPATGVVMSRHVEPGSKLMLSGTETHSALAVKLYDPTKLQVRVDVPIADASHVGVGQAAKIVVGVLPDKTFDGVVTRLVHEADIQRNTVQVKVAIQSPTPELKPEMLARVRFAAGGAAPGAAGVAAENGVVSQRVFAPQRLLRRDGQSPQATAWVVDKGRGIATQRRVTLGAERRGDWAAVTSGLQPGDALIADASALHEGDRVRVVGEDEAQDDAAPAGAVEGSRHGPH